MTEAPPEPKPDNTKKIYAFFDDLWLAFINWLSAAVTAVLNTLIATYNRIALAVESILKGLLAALDTALSEIVLTVRSWIATVQTLFNNLLVAIQDAITALFNALYNATVAVIDKVTKFVVDVTDRIKSLVSLVADAVVKFIGDAATAIKNLVTGFLQQAGEALAKIVDKTAGLIATTLGTLAAAVKANEDAITDEWLRLVAGADALLQATLKDVADLAQAFRTAMDSLAKTINQGVDRIDKAGQDAIKTLTEFLLADAAPQEGQLLAQKAEQLMAGGLRVDDFRQLIADIVGILPANNRVTRAIGTGLLLAAVAVPGYWQVASAYSNIVLQELALVMPFNVLSPSDAIGAYRRTGLDRGSAATAIRKGGWNEQDANLMIDNSNIVPSPELVMAAWLRGAVDDGVMEDALFQQGFSAGWRGVFSEMAFLIPPVQDLITMAVREAFSPEIAALFGQFEDFPEDFAVWARKQGLSREWAERYWAAHWSLPSADQGFEMLHRGIISADELNKLLRALDVMPFWREKLTQIAFNPFTRIDIRRMHALGILNEEQVLRAYKDLGYNDEKAGQLTAFTLKLNKPKPSQDDEELGKLSRAAILGFYKDGLLTRDRAAQLLVIGGHTPEAADLYLETVDMETERTIRQQSIELIIDEFKAGSLTYEEAIDALNRLGLATLEVGKAVDQLVRASKAQNKLPSLSDGRAFYLADIINRDSFADLLKRLGYTPLWVAAYLSLADLEKANAAKSGKP